MKAVFSETALSEIEESLIWLGNRNPHAALDLKLAIGAAVGRLEAFPLSGRMTSNPGVRTLIVPKFGYRMFYKIEGDNIQILHVRHGARDWPDDLS